uniref:hypothetical protein n=1 Tax=Escherichia coli TaxID=562 RepID=UPI00254BB45A
NPCGVTVYKNIKFKSLIFNDKNYFIVFLLAKINFIQPFDFIDVRFYFGEGFLYHLYPNYKSTFY